MGNEKLLFRLEQPHGTGDIYISWQNGSGMYLATTGIDAIINIFDRYGEIQERIRLPSLCTGFGWDSDGDLLGMICSQPQLIIWDSHTLKKSTIDVGLKDFLCCLIWAKTSPILAIGTAKGNVSIYNHNTTRRTPIIGKHNKKITCGAWNVDNLLALGSEDKTISVSNIDGDTLRVINLRAEPNEIQFSEMKLDERMGGENTISVIIGKKTLYLYNLLDADNPIELAFQNHYGSIVTYKWYGDGYILIGFSSGYFISISTHIKEVGQELFQVRNHKNTLTDITICNSLNKAASCGDNNVKIHDLANLQETSSVLTLAQEAGIDRIAWSKDGQLLGVCTKGGSLNVYVSHMVSLTAVSPPRIAILSSLTEISLYNYTVDKSCLTPISIQLEIEPQCIAVGPYHLAASMNNRIWLYDLTKPKIDSVDAPLLLNEKQYLGIVQSVKLNPEYASVLFDGKIQLHMIEDPENNEERDTITFPNQQHNTKMESLITTHSLTPDFLIYANDMGEIIYFHIEDWAISNLHQHNVGILDIYPDLSGTRLIFIDIKYKAYLYNAVSDSIIQIQELPEKIKGVTWDSNIQDRNIFIMYDDKDIWTYVYVPFSVNGTYVKKVGQTTLVTKQTPLLMYSGELMSGTSGGQVTQINLSTHDFVQIGIDERDKTILESNFHKQIELLRFNSAFTTYQHLQDKVLLKTLGTEAMKHLEIETAIRAYRALDDVAMVWNLEYLLQFEELKLLAGFMSMYVNDYDKAQEWFLLSSNPLSALEMRRDLLDWDRALQLAKKMAPDQISQLSREYAQQLEFTSNYSEALLNYEKALQENLGEEHILICKCGIARTNLHLNNLRHGLSVVYELENSTLNKECAEILEKKNQLKEAALLYEKCGLYDKAASGYITLKLWDKIKSILPNITSNKIYIQYAKAKEMEHNYIEAVEAYEKAKDFDSVIRIHLEKLKNPEIAVELVNETKSVEGAKMVAKFFQNLNDTKSAIKFLVMSRCLDEAYDLSKKSGKMEVYGDILIDEYQDVSEKDFTTVAQYFENDRNHILAGKFWFYARNYQKAMNHLLKASKSSTHESHALSLAIDVVASSKSSTLSTLLIEHLLGETDGIPKDPKHLFRLYMATKKYKEASKSAQIIADEEQINGNYRNSHDVLFAMFQELRENDIRVEKEMYDSLMLLHSYILVRLHVKRGDHLKGARMLIRVADNISRFPSHVVPILTSTVIECHRAGLKHAAFKYASLLLTNPEYRKNIDAKYVKKIEAVVRKAPKITKTADGENMVEIAGDNEEPATPCPFCENLVKESQLYCSSCKNNIPFCIVTGRHITSDLTACPECNFPALRTEFIEILDNDDSCPMCSEKVDPRRLQKITDFSRYLSID